MFNFFPFNLYGFGYLGVYLSLALGIMGIPIPDEAIMTYVGFLIYKGEYALGFSLLFSFLGSITGMSVSFFIGKGIMGSLAARFVNKHKKSYEAYQSLFARYGNLIIIFGYFFPGIRHLTAYSSGLLKMRYPKFLLYASIGGSIWVTTFILLGYRLGQDWLYFLHLIIHFKRLVFAALILLLIVFLYFARKKIK